MYKPFIEEQNKSIPHMDTELTPASVRSISDLDMDNFVGGTKEEITLKQQIQAFSTGFVAGFCPRAGAALVCDDSNEAINSGFTLGNAIGYLCPGILVGCFIQLIKAGLK